MIIKCSRLFNAVACIAKFPYINEIPCRLHCYRAMHSELRKTLTSSWYFLVKGSIFTGIHTVRLGGIGGIGMARPEDVDAIHYFDPAP